MPRFDQALIKQLVDLATNITPEEFEAVWEKLPYFYGKLSPLSRSPHSSMNMTYAEQYKRPKAIPIAVAETAVCFIPFVGMPVGLGDMYRRYYSAQYVEKRISTANSRKCHVDSEIRKRQLNYVDGTQFFLHGEGNEDLCSAKYTFICLLLAFKKITVNGAFQDNVTLFTEIDTISTDLQKRHLAPEMVVALVMKRNPRNRFSAITLENLEAAIKQACDSYINRPRSIVDTAASYFRSDKLKQNRANNLAARLPGFAAQDKQPFGTFNFATLCNNHNNNALQILLFLLTTDEGLTTADSFKTLLVSALANVANFPAIDERANGVNHVVGDLLKELFCPAPIEAAAIAATTSTEAPAIAATTSARIS